MQPSTRLLLLALAVAVVGALGFALLTGCSGEPEERAEEECDDCMLLSDSFGSERAEDFLIAWPINPMSLDIGGECRISLDHEEWKVSLECACELLLKNRDELKAHEMFGWAATAQLLYERDCMEVEGAD